MLLLAALVATAAWSCGFAQNIPMQSPLSVTKTKGSVRLECHFKDVSANFDSTVIHWYQQKVNKAPVRMLYFSGSIAVDDGFQANRYTIQKDSSQKLCILTIHDVTPDDTATYYCAYWETHRGRNSEITETNKGHIPPASSEILQKEHGNMITYVCLIEKFYPDVIRVTWTDGESKEVTDNVVKGDTWSPENDDRYSISSWLTVPVENKDKNYNCKYEHESQQRSLPTQDSTKTAPPEEDCSANRGNSTVFNRDHLMHRTAYLVYIVLLLKSTMYYLIVLFFIYRMWAPTKHQGKTA